MTIRRLLWGSLILAVACFWWAHCGPSRVWVTFSNLPRGTCFTTVVMERNGVLRNLNWYYMTELLVPMTSHPGQDVGSEMPRAREDVRPVVTWGLQPSGLSPDSAYPVEWVSGDRYGVVTKSRSGVWEITWFRPEQAAPQRAIRYLGGKVVVLDMTRGVRERIDTVQVSELLDKQLGLVEYSPAPTWPEERQ